MIKQYKFKKEDGAGIIDLSLTILRIMNKMKINSVKIEGNHPILKRMDWNIIIIKEGKEIFYTQIKEITECLKTGYEIKMINNEEDKELWKNQLEGNWNVSKEMN